ncbi:MAG: US12 family protein [Verrucomicrobiales bacterium]|mgnify:CR=1 FL=1|jgi:FtsH-binding integral membrane protein|nr:US12 family protein [Verrucomicrobiales bacterium]MBP9225710.1 US12 family protein [Verrucomicrobiales bacterium]
MNNTGYANPFTVASAAPAERTAFIRQTYLHLGFAILGFIVVEWFLLNQSWSAALIQKMVGGMGWLIVLGAFMGISFIANRLAESEASRGTQYLGLILFVVAEAFIFMPLLYMAMVYSNDGQVILKAGVTTGFVFGGITFAAFATGKDFSFLRGFLMVGGFVAMGIIIVSIIFGFNLGTIFAGAMALFAAVSILYNTSNIIHHYRTDQYVSASLSLFASVALLFWYILRIFMNRN